jgi:hypothetical protein
MRPKPEMLSATTTVWMLAAIACAALPFLHAVPALQTAGAFGGFMALLGALIIGLAAAVPLSVVARRLCGFESSTPFSWGSLTPGYAALSGIIGWGLPVGLILALDDFLRSRSWLVVIPGAVIWPLAGAAFGLVMRWLALRRERG